MSFKDNSYLERQISEELDKASHLRKQINQEYSSLVQLLHDFKEFRVLQTTDFTFEEYLEHLKAQQIEEEESNKSSVKVSSVAVSNKKPVTQKKISYFSGRKTTSNNEIQVKVNLFYPSNVEIFDVLLKKDKSASQADL
jgi:hypothetical protein